MAAQELDDGGRLLQRSPSASLRARRPGLKAYISTSRQQQGARSGPLRGRAPSDLDACRWMDCRLQARPARRSTHGARRGGTSCSVRSAGGVGLDHLALDRFLLRRLPKLNGLGALMATTHHLADAVTGIPGDRLCQVRLAACRRLPIPDPGAQSPLPGAGPTCATLPRLPADPESQADEPSGLAGRPAPPRASHHERHKPSSAIRYQLTLRQASASTTGGSSNTNMPCSWVVSDPLRRWGGPTCLRTSVLYVSREDALIRFIRLASG